MVSSKPSSSTSGPLAQIQKLESTLLSTPFNPNPLLPLLALARHDSAEVVHKGVWALHRVFIQFINDKRVASISGNEGVVGQTADAETDQASGGGLGAEGLSQDASAGWEVKVWVKERLMEYVRVLGGLLRDKEEALRHSAVPLLFSLLPSLSLIASPPPNQPVLHIPYMRLIIRQLLYPAPSLRGATIRKSGEWKFIPAHQVDLEDGTLPSGIIELVDEDFWAKYDDLRWAFFREAAYIIQNERSLECPSNLLGQVIPLTNLPKLPEDINAFYVPSLADPPSSTGEGGKNVEGGKVNKKAKGKGKGKGKDKDGDLDSTPDWMAYYDDDASSDEETSSSGTVKAGTKRARPGAGAGAGKTKRTSQLSILAGIHSIPSHQAVYTTLWETIFSHVKLDASWTRKILVGLHGSKGILGHMKPERRVRVADWLGSLIDGGGANAMLAMNGLYILMTQYNLDYPNFYHRLYSLLDRNVMHVKYRARFFRLLDTFLSSSLLPAALVASFIKRLSRLALTSPPAGIIMLIPFIYNLFKRHPGCMVMIQRLPDENEGEEAGAYKDPYNASDPSPTSSNAIASSCWELAALQTHYLSSVSTLAKIFTEVFTKPQFNMEDFLDHGYGTLFDTEIKRKIKYPPALSMSLEVGDVSAGLGELFPGKEVEEEVRAAGDVVSQLWSF